MILAIFRVLGIGLFMYLLWRKLREDYLDDEVVSLSWVTILAFLVGGRLAFGLENWGVWNDNLSRWILFWQNPGFNYLVGYLSMLGGVWWFLRVKKWKTMTVLEDMVTPILFLFTFFWIDEYIRSGFDFEVAKVAPFLVLTMILGWWMRRKYRSFEWYKSGKKGFLFWFVNASGFGLMIAWSFWAGIDWLWRILAMFLSLISVVGLFILGEVLTDFKILRRKTNE
jgi:hypothetical protein